jgi:hypothetical protein
MRSMSAAPPRRPQEVRAWLESEPTLQELQEAYPQDWEAVQRKLAELVPTGDRVQLTRYIDSQRDVRRAMAVAAVKQLALQAATGAKAGERVRFNLVNGKLLQRIFFEGSGFRRKPVSLGQFKRWWPRITQRNLLMPLVAKKGIYCFYSEPLVKELAALIGDRRAVEIAAGDGTLTRFLKDAGVNIVATDDHSWKDVDFPAEVIKEDAKTSLKQRSPQVVLCSWPPAENSFERAVFKTKSVELYIVIGSRHRFAAGNWRTYEEQTAFTGAEAEELSALVLPPDIDPAVYLFRR